MARLIPLLSLCVISTLHQTCGKDNSAKDFIELTKQPYFVDHTELMRYFYEDPFFTIAFVSCPRGFGKTTNLQMIQLFNDLELDADHIPKPMNQTLAYQIFSKMSVGHELYYRWIRDNVGQHPTCLPKRCIKSTSYNPIAYSTSTLELIKKLSQKKLANKFEIGEAFYRFAHFLQIYYQSGVLILIDDYDSAFIKSSKPNKQQIEFFYQFINDVIKHVAQPPQNEVTRNIWITATNGMLYPSIVKDLEKAYITSCLEGEWVLDYYGFSEADVAELAKKYKLTPKQTEEIKQHYGGYTLQNFTTLYNPSSVIQYFKNLETEKDKALKSYWQIGKNDDFLRGFRDDQVFRDIVQDIVSDGTTEFGLMGEYNISDIKRFINLNDKYQYKKTDYNTLIKYVYEQGYVTYNSVANDTAMFSTFGYKAANLETKQALKTLILD
ncbi:hypothetical protein U1Q18_051202 [Sarracenia purpurea var. burkii]